MTTGSFDEGKLSDRFLTKTIYLERSFQTRVGPASCTWNLKLVNKSQLLWKPKLLHVLFPSQIVVVWDVVVDWNFRADASAVLEFLIDIPSTSNHCCNWELVLLFPDLWAIDRFLTIDAKVGRDEVWPQFRITVYAMNVATTSPGDDPTRPV
jgi:hypothetical protein